MTRRQGRALRLLAAPLTIIAVLVSGQAPAAAQLRVDAPVAISDRSPVDNCGIVLPPPFEASRMRPPDTATEPHIAVNPRDPRNIVAAWIQDFSETHVVAATKDGGRTWTRSTPPGLGNCTGSEGAPVDPVLVFGTDGVLYLTSMRAIVPPARTGPDNAIVVNRSTDGGLTWSDAVVVEPRNAFNDHPWMAADPTSPRRLYVAWTKPQEPLGGRSLGSYLSISDDAGETWTPARRIATPPREFITHSGTLLATRPDGTLVMLFRQRDEQNFLPATPRVDTQIMAMTSRDRGATWSERVAVGPQAPSDTPSDPDSGDEFESGLPSLYGGREAFHVTWHDVRAGTWRILYSRSTDGLNWSTPKAVVEGPSPAVLSSVAEAGDGTIGVTWFDTRNDRRGDSEWTADVWMAASRDGGASWETAHVAGPMDLRGAWLDGRGIPEPGPRFIGDYAGLAGLPDGFAAALPLTRPLNRVGMSQVFFVRGVARGGSRRLGISVRPRLARAHRLRTFQIQVTVRRDGLSRPVRGARVSLSRRRAITNSRGRAAITTTLRRGRNRIVVRVPGFRTRTRVVRGR